MDKREWGLVQPHKTQETALSQIVKKLDNAAKDADKAHTHGEEPGAGAGTPMLERSNVYGILGSRGAGKSTVLKALYLNYASDSAPWFMLPCLDCSVLSEGVNPGTAILLHLKKSLKNPDLVKSLNKPDLVQTFDDLDHLTGLYNHTSLHFRELSMELATSQEEYNRYMVKGLSARLELSEKLMEWLENILKNIERQLCIVLLDDFDLIENHQVRRWFTCLMDEMRQQRLVFVLTADFQRLECLSADKKKGFDSNTARALVNKLLPPENRVELQPWQKITPTPLKPPFKEMIKPYALGQDRLCLNLLPQRPRGLVNLNLTLKEWQGEEGEDEPKRAEKFLALLANCCEESYLARAFQEVKGKDWFAEMKFPSDPCPDEEWQEIVYSSRGRISRDEQDTLNPISGLNHNDLWIPLSPLQAHRRALWGELLINLSIARGLVAESLALRYRLRFIQSWRPVASKLTKATFTIESTRQNIRDFFEGGDWFPGRSGLLWMNTKMGKKPKVHIGWSPLVEGLKAVRMPFWNRVLTDLLIDPSVFEDDAGIRKKGTTHKALAILPNEVWAIVLLADGLERCCWPVFTAGLGWHLSTFLVLAAALVRSAYAYALMQCDRLTLNDFHIAQREIIHMLDNRDPFTWLRENEEGVITRLRSLFTRDFQARLRGKNDALSNAARMYLKSPAYQSARALLQTIAEDVLD